MRKSYCIYDASRCEDLGRSFAAFGYSGEQVFTCCLALKLSSGARALIIRAWKEQNARG